MGLPKVMLHLGLEHQTTLLLQVEAKYPALLFKQQLDAFVQKIFPMLRDNVKKEITPQLAACIHAPRTATTRNRRTRDLTTALSGEGPSTPSLSYLFLSCMLIKQEEGL